MRSENLFITREKTMEKHLFAKFKSTLRNFFLHEKGVVAVLTGLVFVVVIGFAALALDASFWYSEKRELQFAADAGAAGGALALKSTGAVTFRDYARADIQANGCTDTNNCTVVAINNPPTSGPSAGNTGAVEVRLSKPASVFLSGFFLSDTPTINVRSVVGNLPSNNCIVALANSGIGVNVKGGGAVVSPNCGVYANSSDSKAINVVGGGSITTNNVTSHGGINTAGGGTIVGSQATSAPITADPYAGVTMPTPSSTCTATNKLVSGNQTINPGTYCGGITLQSSAKLTMSPGVYFLVQSGTSPSKAGNFKAVASSVITANGVTIVMTTKSGAGSTNYGTVNFPAQVSTNMSAPTTGSTAGILFFGDRKSSGLTENFTGGGTQTLSGVLYFPTNNVNYAGQSGVTGNPCFQIVSSTVTFTGGSLLGNSCPSTGLGNTMFLE